MEHRIEQALEQRKRKGSFRRLPAAAASSSAVLTKDPSLEPPNVNRQRHNDDEYLLDVFNNDDSNNNYNAIDFSTNDYLGLASNTDQCQLVNDTYCKIIQQRQYSHKILGSTGSRLLSGDSSMHHAIEHFIVQQHSRDNRKAALLCNSGYDANLCVVSCLPCDIIVYDEYCHNSLHMGIRLWESYNTNNNSTNTGNGNDSSRQQPSKQNHNHQRRQSFSFEHNNVIDLEKKLIQIRQNQRNHDNIDLVICIIIESVYSMDGDIADVVSTLNIAHRYNAKVIVDEAHGIGVYGTATKGTGVLAHYNLTNHPSLLYTICTFGKGPGCHGAVIICSSNQCKDYLINYAYPFIYSTALPLHSVIAIYCSYLTMTGLKGIQLRRSLFQNIQYFRSKLQQHYAHMSNHRNDDNNRVTVTLLPSTSPIQALMIPGNELCTQFCALVYYNSNHCILLYPIKSPTIPMGQERVRIIIHSHNTIPEMDTLIQMIVQTVDEMNLILRIPPPPTTAQLEHNNENLVARL